MATAPRNASILDAAGSMNEFGKQRRNRNVTNLVPFRISVYGEGPSNSGDHEARHAADADQPRKIGGLARKAADVTVRSMKTSRSVTART